MDRKKLLPQSGQTNKGGAIVLAKDALVPGVKVSKIRPRKKVLKEAPEATTAKRRLFDINKIFGSNLFSSRKRYKNRVKSIQKQRKEEKESSLEKRQVNPKTTKVPKPELPKTGLLDGVKNYISNVLMGILFTNIEKIIPVIQGVWNGIKPIVGFIEKIGGGILNGLITLINEGYKAYDQTRKWIGEKWGTKGTENFDKFTKEFEKFIITAIGIGVAYSKIKLKPPIPCPVPPNTSNKPGVPWWKKDTSSLARSNQSYSRFVQGQANIGDRARLLRRGQIGPTGMFTKGGFNQQGQLRGQSFRRPTAPSTGTAVPGRVSPQMAGWLKGFGKVARAIGLYFLFQEIERDISRGDYKAVVVKLSAYGLGWATTSFLAAAGLAATGTGVGAVPGVAIVAGSMAAGAGVDYGVRKAFGYAQGGQITRNGVPVGGTISRSLPKSTSTNRRKVADPQKSYPGKDVGGRKRIEDFYSERAIKVLREAVNIRNVGTLDGVFGSAMAAPVDAILGQRTSTQAVRGIGDSFGAYIENLVNVEIDNANKTGTMKSDIGKKIGTSISQSLTSSMNNYINGIIDELKKQMGRPPSGGGTSGGGGGQPSPTELPGGVVPGDAPPEIKALLDAIASGEGSWDSVNPSTSVPGLSKMTIAEARRAALAKRDSIGKGTGAMGKWQHLPDYNGSNEIKKRAEAAGLNYEKDLFSPENQTRITRVWMSSLISGGEAQIVKDLQKDPLAVAKRLNKVFPSLPGGSQQNQDETLFKQRYDNNVKKYQKLQGTSTFTGGTKPSAILSSPIGPRWGGYHAGNDYAIDAGTPISLLKSGTAKVGYDPGGYGNYVEITHPDGSKSLYGHLNTVKVSNGQNVSAGSVIGNVGTTGRVTGPHVHFEYTGTDGKRVASASVLDSLADQTFRLGSVKPSIVSNLALNKGVEGVIEDGKWREKTWTPEEKRRYEQSQDLKRKQNQNQGFMFRGGKFYQRGGNLGGLLDKEIRVTDEENPRLRALPSFLGRGKKEGEVKQGPDGKLYYWDGKIWKTYRGQDKPQDVSSLTPSSINAQIAFAPLPKEVMGIQQSTRIEKEIVVVRSTTIIDKTA